MRRTFVQKQRRVRFNGRVVPTAVLALCSVRVLAQQNIKQEDQQIVLTGRIKLIHEFGPPSYGEDPKHDAHVSYWALVPHIPVNLPCTPEKQKFDNADCQPANRINLYFHGFELKKLNELPAAKFEGKRVVVEGKLHRADVAGEMTPIYMDVTGISATPTQPVRNR